MFSFLFDLAFVLIMGGTAWVVARRKVVDSAVILLAILIAGLVSIVGFEPVAAWCRRRLFSPTDIAITKFFWSFFALFIFVVVFVVLHQGFSRISGRTPELGSFAESVGCWVIGGAAGYFLAAFLLTVVHTLPVPRDFQGTLPPEAHRRSGPVMALAPDYQFLAFVDYTCSPRSAFGGTRWNLGRPVFSASLDNGHWASFPVRYALWREELQLLSEDSDQEPAEEDQSDEDG